MNLFELAASCRYNPLAWSEYSQDWGVGQLEGKAIRTWQRDVFGIVRDKLSNESTRYQPIKVAVGAGHGIGKSAAIGMFCNWAMSTAADTRIVITANTDTQMRTKTMPEVMKWFRTSITHDWFNYASTSFTSATDPVSWRMDFVPWSDHNTEAFAGLHNEGKRIVIIFDEASAISDKVWEVTEGALTDENTEIIWLAFGNMTRNTGRFYQCMTDDDWIMLNVDSRTVEGTNKEYLDAFVKKHGEDSDVTRVRIRGLPPVSGEDSFISAVDVDNAICREVSTDNKYAPSVICVDPSWTGGDEFVIGLRQGYVFKILERIQSNDDDVRMQNKIAAYEDMYMADAVFIDEGYGTGIASIARAQGRNWRLVPFGGKADSKEYLNKRAEMWGRMKQWIRDGGSLPDEKALRTELITPKLVPRVDGKIQIESKINMKKRGARSPNIADALAISFAFEVKKRDRMLDMYHELKGKGTSKDDYR